MQDLEISDTLGILMAVKRGHIDLDPDYEDVTEQQTKRQRVFEEDAKEVTRHKIENIIKQQFSMEIQNKEEEVDEVDQRLNQSKLVMDRLRACIIANFYSKAGQQRFLQIKQNPNEIPCIHPTVKEHIGKAPKNYQPVDDNFIKAEISIPCNQNIVKKEPIENYVSNDVAVTKPEASGQVQLPDVPAVKQDPDGGRSSRFKMKKRIVVGNVSKYIPVDRREDNDQSTHKWMVYVRGSKEEPKIDHFIKKVWFFLHPSYRPNDLVEVSQPPFHLTRRGWGEFPVRIQLHFKDDRNKRVDIIHQLKLDRTYTGLQTLGSETLVDVELEKEKIEDKTQSVSIPTTFDLKTQLKIESTNWDPVNEQNITITEHQSPKTPRKMTSLVNGIENINKTPTLLSNQNVKDKIIQHIGSTNKEQLLQPSSLIIKSGVCSTGPAKSVLDSKPVQVLLGNVGSLTNPHLTNEKGDNNKCITDQKLCNGKGDKITIAFTSDLKDKKSDSSVVLQGIGSLNKTITPSQNQLRLLSGAAAKSGSLPSPMKVNTAAVINQVNKNPVQPINQSKSVVTTVQSSPVKANLMVSQLAQHLTGNFLVNNTSVTRPIIQKTQSSMLLIQTVPQTTKPKTTVAQPTVTTSVASDSVSKVSKTSPVICAINTQPPQSKSTSVLPPNPSSATTPQTLYYRCKDAQGNVFLVPQQLLKQVIQPSTKPLTEVSSASPIIAASPTSKTNVSQTFTKPTAIISSATNSVGIATLAGTKSQVSVTLAGTKSQLPATLAGTKSQVSATLAGIKSQVPSTVFLNPSVNPKVRPDLQQPLLSAALTNKQSAVIGASGIPRQNSPIILSVNSTGQANSQQTSNVQTKSLLKSAITSIQGQNIGTGIANGVLNVKSTHDQGKITKDVGKGSSLVPQVGGNKPQTVNVSSALAQILTAGPHTLKDGPNKSNVSNVVYKPSVITNNLQTTNRSGNSLLFTVNSSNGKTVVMPTQNLSASTVNKTAGASLLLQSNQKERTSGSDANVNVQKQNTPKNVLENNSIKIIIEEKPKPTVQSTANSIINVTQQLVKMTTPSQSVVQNSVTNSGLEPSVRSQGQLTSQGQLQVTPQGLKIVLNNVTNTPTGASQPVSLITRVNNVGKNITKEEPVIKLNSAENIQKANNNSLVVKGSHIVGPSNYSSSLLKTKNTSSSPLPTPTLTLNKTGVCPSLTLTSSEAKGQGSSVLSSQTNSILGTIGDKKIVVDLAMESDKKQQSSTQGEKRIICLRKKSEFRRPPSPPIIVENIKPIYRPEDYPDVLSLVREAVKRHPVVSMTANKYQHPYCAYSSEEWLSWKLGKRRASEWQRACFCRRYIKEQIKGETFKGQKLWTTKQIMLWCRLHAFSPHYLESTLHPFGVELTADRIGKKFTSVTYSGEITQKADDMLQGTTTEAFDDMEIDILNTEQPPVKKPIKEQEEIDLSDVDFVPPSDSALFVQDSCQKIGVKFDPAEIIPTVYSNTSEDMIFSAMKSFIGDIVTESFACKVSNERYPDSLSMTDVFQALSSMSQADFLSNIHLGVRTTDNSNR